MTNSTPQCPRGLREDCRFIQSSGSTTAAYYPPIYDKNGVNTNPDRNITTSAEGIVALLREVINQLQQSPGVVMCYDILELCDELENL